MTEPMTESEVETDDDELDYDSGDDYMDEDFEDFDDEDLEDLAQELEEAGIDIKDLTLEELKRLAPLSMLLPHMSLDQMKQALKKNVFSPDGRPIVRTTVQKFRPIPRITQIVSYSMGGVIGFTWGNYFLCIIQGKQNTLCLFCRR